MHTSIITLFLFATALHAGVFTNYEVNSYAAGKKFVSTVTGERVLKTPVWRVDADSPPLAPRKAEHLATAKFQQLISDTKDWKLQGITLEDAGDGLHWVYVIQFTQAGTWSGPAPFLKVIVLMDGTVVEPKIRDNK